MAALPVSLAADKQPKQTYLLLQVLRGVAATMVVVYHDSILASERLDAGPYHWDAGAAGVDIFFVISGFVMALSVAKLGIGPAQALTFFKRRLERIVPLYWLATTLKVVVLLLLPALALQGLGSWYHVLASYLFLPNRVSAVPALPVILVGWTLNLEMLFYVLFAAALAMRFRLLPFLIPVLGLIALVPVFYPVRPFWLQVFNPIIFEFIYGILLYRLTQRLATRERHLPWPAAFALLIAGFAAILLRPQTLNTYARPLWWGLPALAILAAVVSLEKVAGRLMPGWLLEIGDGSYSIYLTHTFVLPLAGLALLHLRQTGSASRLPAMLVGVPLSLLAGLAVYRLVELPIIRHFRGRHRMVPPSHA